MKKAGLPSTPAPDAMPHDKKFKVCRTWLCVKLVSGCWEKCGFLFVPCPQKPDSKKRRLGAMKPIKSNVHMAGTAEGAAIQRIREETHKKMMAAHHQQNFGRR
jgi:hypothetical protein